MGARGGALVGAGREGEVGRHAAVEAVKTGQQALRIVGAAEAAALVPQLRGHGCVAFPAARQCQAEHEKHNNQGVKRPPPLYPCLVAARGDVGGRVGDPGPHRGEAVVKGGGRAAFRPRPGCRLPLQDRAELRVQRPDQNLLGRLGAAPAALSGRHADRLPVGGLVAGAVEAGRVDEGLAEDRAAAVVRLPAFRKPAQGQRQRLRRQIVDADPRQHEKAMEWTPPICGVMMRQNKNARLCASETRKEASMEKVSIVGVDISKRVFQLHGSTASGRPVFVKKLSRSGFLPFLEDLPPCLVVMEACGGAHHWGRQIIAKGHECRLIPPVYVKPFVKRQKSDANDAAAIVEAAQRPSMRFVAVKPEAAQADAMLFRTRALFVRQRTQTVNALRGHLAEFGLVSARGVANVEALRAELEKAAEGVPELVQQSAEMLFGQIDAAERADRGAGPRAEAPLAGAGGHPEPDDNPRGRADQRDGGARVRAADGELPHAAGTSPPGRA